MPSAHARRARVQVSGFRVQVSGRQPRQLSFGQLSSYNAALSFQSFESLDVWKRASRLAVDVYAALEGCRDYGLRDQISRSAVSVPSNIAEGYERDTNAEFVRFLNIAKGSAAELRTQLYIAGETGKLNKDALAPLIQEAKSVSAMLHALAKSRKQRISDEAGPVSDLDFPEP